MGPLVLSVVALLSGSAGAAEISPSTAYALARTRGRIADVTVKGDLDLRRLASPPGSTSVELVNVVVRGRAVLHEQGPPATIRFWGCQLDAIDVRGARFRQGLELEQSVVREHANFEGTTFGGAFKLIGPVEWRGKAIFRRATFEKPVEILGMTFVGLPGLDGGVSFADATFRASARFDESRFGTTVRFDSAVFEGDASFLRLTAATASFRNTQFRRDAEFRFCRLGQAEFGSGAGDDFKYMSAFHGLADFRGCRMDSARFEFAEFRGDATFVNAQIDDLSLRNASFRGGSTDLGGLRVKGGLHLDRAQFSNLRLRWSEVGEAIRRASPDTTVLGFLRRRLDELGQPDDARDVAYHLATERLGEITKRPGGWSEKAWRHTEWLIWGLPTGYGTKLGRTTLVAVACWVLLSVPIALRRGLIVALPRGLEARLDGGTGAERPRYEPIPRELIAEGGPQKVTVLAQLSVAYRYTFALMFKIPAGGLRLVEPPGARYAWYLKALWGLGSLLLALLALTLANVSPVMQAIVGKLAF